MNKAVFKGFDKTQKNGVAYYKYRGQLYSIVVGAFSASQGQQHRDAQKEIDNMLDNPRISNMTESAGESLRKFFDMLEE